MLFNTCYNVAAKQTLLFDVPAALGQSQPALSRVPAPQHPPHSPCPRLSKHSGSHSWPQPARPPPPTCWLGGCLGPCSTYVASESSGRTA